MKLLVATTQTQGQRKNDFCFVPEDEIVHFATECDREEIDGPCGCKRSMSGLKTKKATTTMKCAEVEITDGELRGLLFDHYAQAWNYPPIEAAKMAEVAACNLTNLGKIFYVGDVVEKRGEVFSIRRINARRNGEGGAG